MKLEKLFEPGNIGKIEIKNRIIMSPMGTISHNPDSSLKDEVADYYDERAKGGVGLIMGQTSRSEERRVGKECRSRWSPYH